MLNMHQIDTIRRMDFEGVPRSKIAETLKISRNTVQKYADMEDFSMEVPAESIHPSILDPFKPIIDQILVDDQKRWRKQRHTARRIFNILVETYGYTGGYTTVQTYVKKQKRSLQVPETFLSLRWAPGEAQVDFGDADFYECGKKQRKHFLVLSFPYSNMAWFQVFGGTNGECVCQGLKDIFEHIGGVPPRIVFDNATGIGHRTKNGMHETKLFQRFKLHYGFKAVFCNPESGNEKGNVERKVGWIRKNHFVPEQCYTDITVFNKEMLTIADNDKGIVHYEKGLTSGVLFENDKDALLPLNPRNFTVQTYKECKTDKYGYVTVDGKHHYQAANTHPLTDVFVLLEAHKVIILDKNGEFLSDHKRLYGDEYTESINPLNELMMLSKKPYAWNNSVARDFFSDSICDWLDLKTKQERKLSFEGIAYSIQETSYASTIYALEQLISSKQSFSAGDIAVYAKRIETFGDNIPDIGPDLNVYNDYFIPGRA